MNQCCVNHHSLSLSLSLSARLGGSKTTELLTLRLWSAAKQRMRHHSTQGVGGGGGGLPPSTLSSSISDQVFCTSEYLGGREQRLFIIIIIMVNTRRFLKRFREKKSWGKNCMRTYAKLYFPCGENCT